MPVLVAVLGTSSGHTAEVVSIVMEGTYFSEPANVRFMVAVEPHEENRMLRIEADSLNLYRASEGPLNGADEKRLHPFVFKNLVGGAYTLRAEVRSYTGVRGLATRSIVVTGREPR